LQIERDENVLCHENEIPKNKTQITNKSQLPKFKISNHGEFESSGTYTFCLHKQFGSERVPD